MRFSTAFSVISVVALAGTALAAPTLRLVSKLDNV